MYTVEKKYLRRQAKGLELKFYYFLPLFSIVLNSYNRCFAGRRGKGEGGEREWGGKSGLVGAGVHCNKNQKVLCSNPTRDSARVRDPC